MSDILRYLERVRVQLRCASEGYSVFLLLSIIFIHYLLFSPPNGFPVNGKIVIEEGWPLGRVAEELSNKRVVRLPQIFTLLVFAFRGNARAVAGEYYFFEPAHAFSVAERVSSGDYGITPSRIILFEGSTVHDYASQLSSILPNVDVKTFIEAARLDEGYLFPDTYLFSPSADTDTVLKELKENFAKKIGPLFPDIARSGRTLREIVIMASMLEKEASREEDRRQIASVLWKRLDASMPLQVDATLDYALGKNTYELTKEDLRSDSPYNTYAYRGLPIGPISNPGLASLRAALYYEDSPYWYYLSDRRGILYFSKTFEEHVAYKKQYLE